MQVDHQADPVTQSEQAAEALDPTVPSRTIRMRHYWFKTGQTVEREYVQAEIGFIPVQRLFTMISKEIKAIVSGKYGINIGDLFNGNLRKLVPQDYDAGGVNKAVQDNLKIIEAFFNLVEVVPELQNKIFALSLGVPRGEVEMFLDAIEEPPHRGGLTIDEGFDILRWFVRQNAVAIRRFFEKQGRGLVEELELWVIHQGVRPPAPEIKAEATEPDLDPDPVVGEPRPGGRPSSTSWQGTPESVS